MAFMGEEGKDYEFKNASSLKQIQTDKGSLLFKNHKLLVPLAIVEC